MIILIILLSLPFIYWYLTRNFNYWSKKGIKGPKPIPGFGNALDFFITPQTIQEMNWIKKYGKIYGTYMGNTPMLTIAEPELIKAILVKDFHLWPDRISNKSTHPIVKKSLGEITGDDWKRNRSITSPTFTSGKMKKMYPLIRECLNDFMTHLDTYANDGKEINVKDIYGNYTMDVIATCALATKTNLYKELDSPFIMNAKQFFKFNIFKLVLALILPNFMTKLLGLGTGSSSGRSEKSQNFFINSTRLIIENRKKSNKKSSDFIQLLIDAEKGSADNIRDENDDNESHHINEGKEELDIEKKTLNVNLINKKLTEDEILAQAFVFLVAGYETTATLLTYCTYELALQPAIQQRLCDEVDAALNSNGEISYEELFRLPYLDAVLSEALRLHPPVLRSVRTSNSEYKLGDTGITLPKGQTIEVPTYAIHHYEEFYPDPYKFNPDRFMPENRHLIKPYTYIPFGAGPRNCIGMRFALLEAKLGLAHIIIRYKFFRNRHTDVPLLPNRVLGVNIPKRVIVGIEYRNL